MFSWAGHIEGWIGLLALSVLQVLLGVDNVVLITVLSWGLPQHERDNARRLGVVVAMVSRLLLLGGIFLLARLQKPFAVIAGLPVSVKSVVLVLGGLFLLYKATKEMYVDMEIRGAHHHKKGKSKVLLAVLLQVFLLDVIFSIDQVLTAVGLSHDVSIQVISILASVIAMALFVNQLAKLLEAHPSLRMIAFSFLALVGISLLAEGTDHPFPHGYLYFGMAYALTVEVINIRRRKNENNKPKEVST